MIDQVVLRMEHVTPTPTASRPPLPLRGGEEERRACGRPFLTPGQGERWFAKRTGVGVLSSESGKQFSCR